VKQATLPLYIRFGGIPEDQQSSVHFGDQVVRKEGGLSVWKAVEANGQYFPVLPEDTNEAGIQDYFSMLFSNKPVYLVTGTEMRLEGACREPLLMDASVIKKLDYSYLKEVSGGREKDV